MTTTLRSRAVRASLAACLALAAVACDDPFGLGGDEADDLADARARWRRAAPARYEFDLNLGCFCPGAGAPVRVTVHDCAVVAVVSLDPTTWPPGYAPRAADYPTVEGLFEWLERAIRRDAAEFEATYHPELGYPTTAAIDYEENVADDEVGWRITRLAPAP